MDQEISNRLLGVQQDLEILRNAIVPMLSIFGEITRRAAEKVGVQLEKKEEIIDAEYEEITDG